MDPREDAGPKLGVGWENAWKMFGMGLKFEEIPPHWPPQKVTLRPGLVRSVQPKKVIVTFDFNDFL